MRSRTGVGARIRTGAHRASLSVEYRCSGYDSRNYHDRSVTEGPFMIRLLSVVFVGLVALMTVPFAFGQTDLPGSKDYPGISRMPGYYIASYQETPFDSYSFTVTEGGKEKQQPVEGRRYDFRYNLMENAAMPSALQIVRNYQNAARSAGGQVLFDTGEAHHDSSHQGRQGGVVCRSRHLTNRAGCSSPWSSSKSKPCSRT